MILNVPFIAPTRKYLCSERCASMYIAYKTGKSILDKEIGPEKLNSEGCYDILTIPKCLEKYIGKKYVCFSLTKEYRYLPSHIVFKNTKNFIKYAIDNDEPLIASVIPDSNYIKFMLSGRPIKYFLHSILIVGYEGKNYLVVHDDVAFKKITLVPHYLVTGSRTGFTFVSNEDLYNYAKMLGETRP